MNIANRLGRQIKWRSITTWRQLKQHIRQFRTRLPTTGLTIQTYSVEPGNSFPGEAELPVVMCTWSRIGQLEDTLKMLEAQEDVSVKLYIWNNNILEILRVNRLLRSYRGIPVEVTHSLYNVGGFGRFYYARRLAEEYPLVVFIDDDQHIPPHAISKLRQEGDVGSIVSCWAFEFNSTENYLDRTPVEAGQSATYCGTGGMIAPTHVFTRDVVFRKCPTQYWFIEDLWISYVADHLLDMSLRKSDAGIRAIEDGKDQSQYLMPRKNEFLFYLHKIGWRF
jgi:hypothetical protein